MRTTIIITWVVACVCWLVLSSIELEEIKDDVSFYKASWEEEKVRVQELRARVQDRDMLDDALKVCYQDTAKQLGMLHDIRWQMKVVIDTCPGRERPPRLPRP